MSYHFFSISDVMNDIIGDITISNDTNAFITSFKSPFYIRGGCFKKQK